MKKLNVLTILAILALLAVVTACANPASSESNEETSPLATPAAGATVGAAETDAPAVVTSEVTVEATSEADSGSTPGAPGDDGEESPAATPTYSAEVQNWPVLLDPEYAFSIRYPSQWLISEADVTEEDAPLVRAYNVQPADWEGETAPVTVEVYEGTEEDVAGVYPGLADAEEQELASYPSRTMQVSDGDNAGATAYVFQNPQREDWWVVVRGAADAETEQVTSMLSSFRWGELPEVEETPEAES